MNVYVESNFVLELTFLQEQHDSCEDILSICEHNQAKLILPAYSFAEPNEKLFRRDRDRKALAATIEDELKELGRSIPYKVETSTFREIAKLLTRSGSEERQRFRVVRDRLLRVAEIIPLDRNVLYPSTVYETQHTLSPQDALIFASILRHLNDTSSEPACFIEKDANDFDDPDMRDLFAKSGCKLIFGFDNGLNYIQSQL